MRPPHTLAALAGLLLVLVSAPAALAQGPASSVGRLVSVQGQVEVERAGVARPATPRLDLFPGDIVRTGGDGRAAILLSDETQVKLNAGSVLRIKAVAARPVRGVVPATVQAGRTLLEIVGGESWVRTPGRPGGLELETPVATATIRGTELTVRVASDGESRVVVISGTVEVANQFGSIALGPGEQGVARAGQAPAKQVLLTPDDAVQWTLHYGTEVSPRDFPLVGGSRQALQAQLVEAMRAVANDPRDPDAHARLGAVHHDLGRSDSAAASFRDALAIQPGHPGALTGLGWVAVEAGRLDEAITHFEPAATSTPAAALGLSLARARRGDFAGAQTALAEGRRRFGASAALLTQGALIDLQAGDVGRARQQVDEAVRLDPGYGRARGLRSNIALTQNRKDEAFAEAQAAVEASPGSSGALVDLSYAHQARFELDRALEAARRAVAADPNSARAHVQVARLLMGYSRIEGFDRIDDAWRAGQRALRLDPRDPLVQSTVGFLLLARNEVDAAVAAFDKAIELGATFPDAYIGLGLAAFRKGLRQDGLAHFQSAVLMDPRVSLAYSYLGKALYDAGRREEALAAFRRARELDPRDPTPDLYEGIALTDLNRPADAIAAFQTSTRKNDNRAVYSSRLLLDQDQAVRNVNLIRAYGNLGQNNRAFIKSVQALHEDPQSSAAHLYYGAAVGLGLGALQAGLSELLQTRILFPVNYNAFARGTHWTVLLDRPALEGTLTLGGGSHDTLSSDLSLAGGMTYPISLAGEFLLTYGETDGPKLHNSDQRKLGSSLFLKWAPDHRSSAYLQMFHVENRTGDATVNLRGFTENNQLAQAGAQTTFLELGYQIKPVPEGNLLLYAQGTYAQNIRTVQRLHDFFDPGFTLLGIGFPGFVEQFDQTADTRVKEPFVDVQAAYLHKIRSHQLWVAADYFFGQPQSVSKTLLRDDFIAIDPVLIAAFLAVFGNSAVNVSTIQTARKERFDREYVGLVLQDVWEIVPGLYLTGALRYDYARDGDLFSELRNSYSVLSPQGGLLWRVTPEHTIRLAAFQHFSTQSHTLISPTNVAGFFLDSPAIPGSTTLEYHAAWDAELTPTTFFHLHGFRKDTDTPFYESTFDGRRVRNMKEATRMGFAAALEQILFRYFGFGASYILARRDGPFEHDGIDQQLLLSGTFVYPFGIDKGALRLAASGVWTYQDIGSARSPVAPKEYWVSAFSAGYELPDKIGDFQVAVENAFRTRFDFQNPGGTLGLRNNVGLSVTPEVRILATLRLHL